MNQILLLLTPRRRSLGNVFRDPGHRIKTAFFAGVGSLLWIGLFMASHQVLAYIKETEDIGDLLAFKLLSMMLLTFFSLLLFSSFLTGLSKLFLSRDLNLVHALPVPRETIFLARWIESTMDSSWMVMIYSIPVLFSYGIIFKAGFFYYLNMILVIFPFCMSASAISAFAVLWAVTLLPAGRLKSVFVVLGLGAFVVLYVAFRLVKPERLADPETFASALLYLQSLNAPASPLLPSTWIYDSLKAGLAGNISGALFHSAIAVTGAGCLVFIDLVTAKILYFKGYSRSQTATVQLFAGKKDHLNGFFAFLPQPVRGFLIKEIKTFRRDQTQWSQVFLIAALVVIYIYNFSALPLEKSPIRVIALQNLFSFLNMALAAFVLTAITARFVFPSISIEGSAFWLVKSAPLSIRSFMRIKYFIYLLPLLVLSQVLIIATNILLQVSPFMMVLSSITLVFMAPAIVALGLGMGAAYPDFTSENPAQSVTSFGGLVFMLISTAFIGIIIALEAGPAYALVMADLKGRPISSLDWIWIWGSFAAGMVIAVLVIRFSFQFGEKRLRVHLPLQPEKPLSTQEKKNC